MTHVGLFTSWAISLVLCAMIVPWLILTGLAWVIYKVCPRVLPFLPFALAIAAIHLIRPLWQ